MWALDMSNKKNIGGPIIVGDDNPITKYQAWSDERKFWAYNEFEVFYEGERLYHALDEIERLQGMLNKLIPVMDAAVTLVCAPSWSGVSDEDINLESVLRSSGFVTPNAELTGVPLLRTPS